MIFISRILLYFSVFGFAQLAAAAGLVLLRSCPGDCLSIEAADTRVCSAVSRKRDFLSAVYCSPGFLFIICLFIYLLIYLFIYLLIHLFIYLFIYLFTYLFIYSFIHLFIFWGYLYRECLQSWIWMTIAEKEDCCFVWWYYSKKSEKIQLSKNHIFH